MENHPGRPSHELLISALQVERHVRVHLKLAAYQLGRAGLPHVPQDSVDDKPSPGRLRSDPHLPHHVEDDLVGHELAAVEILLNRTGQARAVRRGL